MQKSHVGVQTELAKKRKEKEVLEKGLDVSVTIYRGEINLYVSFRITKRIMPTSCLLRFSRERVAILRTAILGHAERLQALLRLSWPDTGEIQDKMYRLVDTFMSAGVDQKWFSAYILVEGVEVMLTTPEICAVGLGFLFERLQ